MEIIQVAVLFIALIVIGIFVLVIGGGGTIFCFHDWKKPKTSFHWSSNVIEYRYVCKKCGKVKIKNKPRKGD